jgi:hypothetical protein
MDFTTLRTPVLAHLDGENVFTLHRGDVDATNIDGLFDRVIGSTAVLTIRDAAESEDVSTNSVTVRGTGGDGYFSEMTVEATFRANDEGADLLLTATGGADWTFASSFPPVAASAMLADLKFTTPRLYLASAATDQMPSAGLYFEGEALLVTALGPYAFLLGEDASQPLAGRIEVQDGVPVMDLTRPDAATADGGTTSLGFFTVPRIEVTVQSDSRLSVVTDEMVAHAECTLSTVIPFSSRASTTPDAGGIPISATITDPANDILFIANLENVINAAMDELHSLVDGLDPSVLLQDLHGFNLADELRLGNLAVSVDPDAQLLNFVSLTVESARPWTIIEGTDTHRPLAVESARLTINLIDPSGSRALTVQVIAEIEVGNGAVELAGVSPDFALSASLKEDSEISLVDVYSLISGSAPTGPPQMDVVEFNIDIQPGVQYSARVTLDGWWPIDVGKSTLALDEMMVAVDYTVGSSPAITLEGRIDIADLQFVAAAVRPAGEAGWDFSGYTLSEDPLSLRGIVVDLLKEFDVTLDSTLPDIFLDELNIDVAPQARHFMFGCVGQIEIGSLTFNLVANVTVDPATTGFDKQVQVTITVGTREFELLFDDNQTGELFVATYDNVGSPGLDIKEDVVKPLDPDVAGYLPDGLVIEIDEVLLAFGASTPATTGQNGTGTTGQGGTPSTTGQDGAAGTTGQDGTATGDQTGASPTTSGKWFMFGLELGKGLSLGGVLSNLPVVGKSLSGNNALGIDRLQLVVASQALDPTILQAVNTALPPDATGPLLENVTSGLNLSTSLNLGGTSRVLSMPATGPGSQTPPAQQTTPPPTSPAVTSGDNAKWYDLQKSFGPLHFNRVGVRYQDGAAWFLLDAALAAAGLTISLDGLALGSPLRKFEPKVDLRGLGIDFRRDPIEIAAAFLLTHRTDSHGDSYDEYDGLAVLKAKALTLSALGSYALVEDHPSLFLYAVLDYPLGGPAFFYVTGLAVGFGYNRSLTVPPIDQVATFPLVTAAVNGDSPPQDVSGLADELNKLATYIEPDLGEYFVAIGIKFISFKMIDSFVLLTVAFGQQFELDVLGLSTLILPTPVPGEPAAVTPLAEVQLALKISFVPAQGFLGISAQLTSASYLVSRACHLTGGFAFYSWFAGPHEGDFVVSIGGYHPKFSVPDHYPRVPRVGLNWQVDSNLSLKAGAYCALTGSALMAGLALQATWTSGSISAWFDASADFIVYWKPLHYDVTIHVEVGGSYTFHFFGTHHVSIDASADLHLWGPELRGDARIHISVVSFTVSFQTGATPAPQALDWPTFKQSFLPADDAICSIALTDGLVTGGSQDPNDFGVINPLHFALVTSSAIPSSVLHIHADVALGTLDYIEVGDQSVVVPFRAASETAPFVQTPPDGAQTKTAGACGIAPMWKRPDEVISTHGITITRDGNDAEHHFAYTPILKSMPTGLWGATIGGDVNRARFIADAVAGFEIRPAVPPTGGITAAIDRDTLLFDPTPISSAFSWEHDMPPFDPAGLDEDARRQQIADTLVGSAAARTSLLTALGVDAGQVDLSEASARAAADSFIVAPQLGAA